MNHFLQTREIKTPYEYSRDAYEAAPAIYQEYIQGELHLRILSFGDNVPCGSIISKDLDWRPNLNVKIEPFGIPEGQRNRIRRVLTELGLAMGVVDIKITPEGEYVWLEVNPQGQFLFLEPLTGINFREHLAKFFIEEAKY